MNWKGFRAIVVGIFMFGMKSGSKEPVTGRKNIKDLDKTIKLFIIMLYFPHILLPSRTD